jgi:hypothetical protein
MSSLPAFDQSIMTPLGSTNKGWGVCAFTSTVYAMYELNPGVRGQVINATLPYRVLAEIKIYLRMLQAENSPLVKAIEDYTRSFTRFGAGYEFCGYFTIANYIQRINQSLPQPNETQKHAETRILKNPKFGIAMPPDAAADYIRRVWQWKATITAAENGADGLIGVHNPTNTGHLYNGLEHWMYRSGGKIYSWGDSFDTVQEAADNVGDTWSVCYVIAVTKV